MSQGPAAVTATRRRTKSIEQWLPLHVSQYLLDTAHLCTVEHGAYLLLLMTAWTRGAVLPNDDRALASIARLSVAQWKRIRPRIEPFFSVVGDTWVQKRLTAEYDKASERSRSFAERGRLGGRPKRLPSPQAPNANDLGAESYSFPPALRQQNAQVALLDKPSDVQLTTNTVGEVSPTTPLGRHKRRPPDEAKPIAKAILERLNGRAGRSFQAVDATLNPIVGLLRRGVTQAQLELVVDGMCARWGPDPQQAEYLRPKTLFAPSNFWNYLGNLESTSATDAASPWSSWAGIVAIGAKHGISEADHATPPAFRAAVIDAAERAGELTPERAQTLRHTR